MVRPKDKCKLCGNVKELALSHIIPEFCYKPIYDEKSRGIRLTVDSPRARPIQIGHRELLLCDACEGHINKFEKYFADCWYKDRLIPKSVPDGGVTITGLDYAPFKLFHLSILWRAHVAAHQDFSTVDLGPFHSEKIRKRLMANDPGPEDEYRIFALALTDNNGNVLHDRIMCPQRRRLDRHTVYTSFFAGCVWNYVISSHSLDQLPGSCLSSAGNLTLARCKFEDNEFVRGFAHELTRRHKTELRKQRQRECP